MQCGIWTWDQMKWRNLGSIRSVPESLIVLITSGQVFVDLELHVDLIILLTESWYDRKHVLTNSWNFKYMDFRLLPRFICMLFLIAHSHTLFHVYCRLKKQLWFIFSTKLCRILGYSCCKDERGISRKDGTTWMPGAVLCFYLIYLLYWTWINPHLTNLLPSFPTLTELEENETKR